MTHLEESSRLCQQCGVVMPPTGRGRPRKFCSDRCRREYHQVTGVCADCGVETRAGAGAKLTPTHCAGCVGPHISERWSDKHRAARDRLAALYLDGVSLKGIAEALGTTPATVGVQISRLRDYGYDLPHRRGAGVVERVREARWGDKD